MLLYRRGTASTDDARAVALVGTRKATQYGKLTARSLGRSLAMSGIVVVSGFAYGIDIECMLGAVRAGGRSIGVLGCGLSVTYPAENQKYIDEILESGAFYSEYPMTTKGRSHQFPERNTVMAGMTLGTCVIEAKEKSGALITADCALEAGRSVMAVPGDITRDNSRGANQLIQAGAKLVTSSEDILEELAPLLRQLMPKRKGDDSTQSEKNDDKSSAVKADDFADQLADLPEQVEKKAASPKEASKDLPSKKPETPAAALKGLSEEARLVLEQLAHEPQYWDDLMQHPDLSGKPYNELANMMLDLTMRGLIIEQPGKLYLLKQPL
jgi:DNA protecting protein DprA